MSACPPTTTSPQGQFRLGDVGSLIRVTVTEKGSNKPLDVALAMHTFIFKKPSGEVIERVPTMTTNGADGLLEYTTADGDLDEAGPWQGQVFLVYATGQWHSDPFSFPVAGNLS